MSFGERHSSGGLYEESRPEQRTAEHHAVDATPAPNFQDAVPDAMNYGDIEPVAQKICSDLTHSGPHIFDALSESITRLQEAFTDWLYRELHTKGVDTGIKLTLRLDENAGLVPAVDHPCHEEIARLIAESPAMTHVFREIAVQSAFLRDLRSMYVLASHDSPEAAYVSMAQRPGENMYQLSLKGDMNHFYFTR